MNLTELVKGLVISKACSVKPSKDSDQTKQVTLAVKFDNVPLQAVFDKAVSGAVIQWQNGPGRSGFDKLKNGQVVHVDFKAPGRTTVDPEVAMKSKLSAMPKADRKAYVDKMLSEVE